MLRFDVPSFFNRHNASRRSSPKFSGAFSFLIRLRSSSNVTSRTQCNEFSTPQWLPTDSFNSLASFSRLLMEYLVSTLNLSPMNRSDSTITTLFKSFHSSLPSSQNRSEVAQHRRNSSRP